LSFPRRLIGTGLEPNATGSRVCAAAATPGGVLSNACRLPLLPLQERAPHRWPQAICSAPALLLRALANPPLDTMAAIPVDLRVVLSLSAMGIPPETLSFK
jgi:hypothetical protein